MTLSLSVALAALVATGCSRHKQEAIKLANEGDARVDLSPSEAISRYEQATQLDPSNHYILYKLAKAYKKKEEWDKVATTLARASDLAPSYASYYKERGWALEQRARKKEISYEDCKEPYKKCIEADINEEECYAQLANAYLWTDDEQKALENLTKAIEHRPSRIEYYPRLADLYIRLGYLKEAETVLNAAKEIAKPGDENLFHVHTLLSEVYRDRDDVNKMVSELEAAKSVNPSDPSLLFSLGMAYSKLKPPKKAEALQMLKGFNARACRSKKAQRYKSECEQAQTTQTRLSGPGS